MSETTNIILYDDPRAARRVEFTAEIDGARIVVPKWLTVDGSFFLYESGARNYSCTHGTCKTCNAIYDRNTAYTLDECRACWELARETRLSERYAKAEKRAWNGEYLYSEAHDLFAEDEEDLLDKINYDSDEVIDAITPDMRVYLCKPNVPSISGDPFEEELAESYEDLPDELIKLIDEFNAAAKDIVLSWSPTNVAMLLEPTE